MIAAVEGRITDALPNNVPDLMLMYLNELNRTRLPGELDNRAVQRDAKIVAWECLKQTYRPKPARLEAVLAALEGDNVDNRLKYLRDRLRILKTVGVAGDKLNFVLDPLAEYLAGLYLVEKYQANEASWREFLAEASEKPGTLEEIRGFLLAVRDCCLVKGKELNIPAFVVEELGKLAGLTLEALEREQRRRRVQRLISALSVPDVEDKLQALENLAKLAAEDRETVKLAIPALQRLLDDNSEEPKVRLAASRILQQLGVAIPFQVANIQEGKLFLSRKEPPPTVVEDLGNGVRLELVAIPGGEFWMGATGGEKGSRDIERPRHLVQVAPFLMGKYPVTQAQWRLVAALPKVKWDLKPEPSSFPGDNRPVEQVSWYEAVELCERLSRATGKKYRLPSEAEWEYACRAVISYQSLVLSEAEVSVVSQESIQKPSLGYVAKVVQK